MKTKNYLSQQLTAAAAIGQKKRDEQLKSIVYQISQTTRMLILINHISERLLRLMDLQQKKHNELSSTNRLKKDERFELNLKAAQDFTKRAISRISLVNDLNLKLDGKKYDAMIADTNYLARIIALVSDRTFCDEQREVEIESFIAGLETKGVIDDNFINAYFRIK